MNRLMLVTLVALSTACVTASAGGAGKATGPAKELGRWSGKPGKLYLRGVSGHMTVTGVATGDTLEIVATARGKDADKARVEFAKGASSITACAMLPARKARCGADGDYELSGTVDDQDLQIDFVVKLPRGTELDVEQVNGGVEASGLTAASKLEVVNGPVVLVAEGGSHAVEAVNGPVDLQLAAGVGPVKVEAVNGPVTIKLGGGAQVKASTVNGPMRIGGNTYRGGEAQVTLGKGGPELSVENVNGPITIGS